MKKKFKGLGRGLDALLLGNQAATSNHDSNHNEGFTSNAKQDRNTIHEKIVLIAIDLIQPGSYQPRLDFNHQALLELSSSIKENGLLQPIILQAINENPKESRYAIIAGQRRYMACKLAGFKEVPAIIRSFSARQSLVLALIENIQRKDLNALEEAMSYKRLIDEFMLTHQEIATTTGKSRSHITNLLRLLNLNPEVKDMLALGSLTMGHARALLALNNNQQLTIAKEILANDLTTSATEQLVTKILATKSLLDDSQKNLQQTNKHALKQQSIKKSNNLDADIAKLENTLADAIGMAVQITHKNNGQGKVVISYSALEELNNLLDCLHIENS